MPPSCTILWPNRKSLPTKSSRILGWVRLWNLTCDRCCQVWVTRMVCTHVTQALVKSECRFCCLSSVCVCVSVYNKPSCYCLRPMNNSFLNATLATIYSMCVCCPPIHPSIRPSIHPSTYRSTYLSIYLYSCHYKLSVSMNIYMNIHGCIVLVYIGLSRLLELRQPEYDWGVGWGGMLTFMWTCGSSWCYAHAVNLRQQLMLRTRGVGGVGWGGMLTFMWTCGSSWCYAHAGWGGVGWDVNVHVNLRQQLMLRTRGVGWGGMLTFMWTCGSSWCYDDTDDVDDDDDEHDPNETC